MISIRRRRTIVLPVLLFSLTWLVLRGHFGWLHHPFTAATSNGTSTLQEVPPSPFQPGLIEFWDATSRALFEAKPDCSLPTEPVEAPLNEFASLKKGFNFRPDLLKIPQQDVERMRAGHTRFVSQIPELAQKLPYANGTRGIAVAASGSLLPVFLVSLKMLRRTGSILPVEIFMESKDMYEKEICEIVLPPMNATCMILSEVLEAVPTRLKMSRYQLKALALALSSFDDVLLLDADNLPIERPEHLLNSEPFLSKGFVSWPDYWANTASPQFYEISSQTVPRTSERAASDAGQLLLSKGKHAPTLLLILYYNHYGPSHYYKLLSQSPGVEGANDETDKETYLAAAMSLNASFHTVATNIATLGYTRIQDKEFKRTGMVQHNPEDDYGKNVLGSKAIEKVRPSFLHANTYKLDASELHEVFNDELRSQRMWGETKPMVERFGRDVEKQVWAETLYTGCHLEHAFSAWEKKKTVCKRIGRAYKFLYN